MTAVRRLHFGSVRRLPSGVWQARFNDLDGRRRTADLTFESRADAVRWLAKTEEALRLDRWVDPDDGKIAVEDWAWRWLDSRVDLKPKTRVSYVSLLRTQILPTFGRRQLGRVRPIEVQEWIARMQRRGLSASRVRQAANLLGALLKTAVAEGMIASNPCASARLPRLQSREMIAFTAEQVEDIADGMSSTFRPLIFVLAYGGLRFGEAAALRRNDIDLVRSRLRVDESLAEVDGALVFGSTKTHQTRYIALPAFLAAMVDEHLATSVDASSDALVFTSPDGHPLRYANFLRRQWRPALRTAGLQPAGLHSLRHTCASLLIANGAPIKSVQAQLGHQSAQLTLDRYGHLYPDEVDVLAGRLEEVHSRARDTRENGTGEGGGQPHGHGDGRETTSDGRRATGTVAEATQR